MRGYRASYDDGVCGMSVGSRNEKVVSSADTSSVTIFILHQSPFRFAVTLLQWKRLLTTKSAYTGPPTYFHSSSTTGFPLASIRESAIFRARFLHTNDDRTLLTANIRPHDDRSTRFHLLWLSLVWVRKHTFQSDYRARCGNLMLFLHYLENTSWLRNLFCERKLPVMFH